MLPRHPLVPAAALVAVLVLAGCSGDSAEAEGSAATRDDVVPLTDLSELELPVTTIGAMPVERPATVAVVGDSLTLSAQEQIYGELARSGIEVVGFDAVEGRRTARELDDKPSGVRAVEQLRAQAPELWIVALGTNDVGGEQQPDDFRADVERLLAAIPAETPVIWLDTWIEGRIERCLELNRVLREVAATRDGMSVVDWFQFGDDPGVIGSDGIHLTDDGQARFAEQMSREISARFG
jgi:lysophospholipase L1-like esterase